MIIEVNKAPLVVRFLLALILSIQLHLTFSQQTHLEGRILDIRRNGIHGVHVVNNRSHELAVTDIDGFFEIFGDLGDTLVMTSVGYETLNIKVDENWPQVGLILFMEEGMLQLDEVMVQSIPPIERFKQEMIEEQPKDSVAFWYFGMEKPVMKGDKMLAGTVHKKLLYAVLQPTSFMYYNLSKSEKEKRKAYQLEKNQLKKESAEFKFTREWVTEVTGYEGDELTSFIAFCDYSDAFLAKTPRYLLMENMLLKKREYEDEKTDE